MISKDAGAAVRWRGDGKEIFYRVPGGDLMSMEVSTTPVFQPGVPKPLFKPPAPSNLNWDVTADGQRFLFAVPVSQNSAAPYTVVLNWQAAVAAILRRGTLGIPGDDQWIAVCQVASVPRGISSVVDRRGLPSPPRMDTLWRCYEECVILDGNLCIIYETRPKTCRDFPHVVVGTHSLGGRPSSLAR
jgi:hypothetical protein